MFVQSVLAVTTLFSTQETVYGRASLEVYYESMCPDCYNFFVDQLRPVSKEFGDDWIYTRLIPYGKAKTVMVPFYVTCQHGTTECLLNAIHGCGIQHLIFPTRDSSLERVLFTSCLFDETWAGAKLADAGETCSSKFGLDWEKVSSCANGIEGKNYILTNRMQTEKLQPPLTEVPTIAINGYRGDEKYQYEVTNNLKKAICDTYAHEGRTPDACKN